MMFKCLTLAETNNWRVVSCLSTSEIQNLNCCGVLQGKLRGPRILPAFLCLLSWGTRLAKLEAVYVLGSTPAGLCSCGVCSLLLISKFSLTPTQFLTGRKLNSSGNSVSDNTDYVATKKKRLVCYLAYLPPGKPFTRSSRTGRSGEIREILFPSIKEAAEFRASALLWSTISMINMQNIRCSKSNRQ